jgi:hypothetical protein
MLQGVACLKRKENTFGDPPKKAYPFKGLSINTKERFYEITT